ncbi:hypothetical protein WA026_013418 [Henosepilachna vigintioctopunctata]|uniref:Uncharacterized protein n=1 Tax=Henosepilachna vigintioctopunctata TaxID=420089 RepID=A0AAW1VD15_9CUCU
MDVATSWRPSAHASTRPGTIEPPPDMGRLEKNLLTQQQQFYVFGRLDAIFLQVLLDLLAPGKGGALLRRRSTAHLAAIPRAKHFEPPYGVGLHGRSRLCLNGGLVLRRDLGGYVRVRAGKGDATLPIRLTARRSFRWGMDSSG